MPPLSGKLAIRAYFGGILSGDIIACEKMRKVSRIVLDELEHGSADGRFHYDEAFASKHINFIERFCRLPSGKLGAPFRLELFQRAILAVIYGFVDSDGARQYREVLWIMGRRIMSFRPVREVSSASGRNLLRNPASTEAASSSGCCSRARRKPSMDRKAEALS